MLDNEKIAKLHDEIMAELTHEDFANRKHYARSTYADGCRGPLCRKAERDRRRVKYDIEKTRFNHVVEAEMDRIVAYYLENNGWKVAVAT